MRLSNKAGFTIIETMLFLGVTGILIFGILAGTGSSINTQRYRDSVTSLQSILQQQYADVASVSNDRNTDWKCNNDGSITQQVGSGDLRGQSDCILLGKYITAAPSGASTKSIMIRNVVGRINPAIPKGQDDVGAFNQYYMTIPVNLSNNKYDISWNSSITKSDGSASTFSILILQSPKSGIIRTFIDPNALIADDKLQSLINTASLAAPVQMCVNYSGLSTGNKLAVKIVAGAASASGVEKLGDNSGCL